VVSCSTWVAALRDALQDADIVGLDPNDRARGVCNRRGFATIAAAATEMPFADSTFDVVTALDVLEHVADDGRAVTELQRVLRPGGIAIVTVPALPWLWGPHDERAHHRQRWPAAAAGHVLQHAARATRGSAATHRARHGQVCRRAEPASQSGQRSPPCRVQGGVGTHSLWPGLSSRPLSAGRRPQGGPRESSWW
jgi:SAM-dependent methyltransferase